MTQEEKQLLFKDLCARLPYGVIVDVSRVEEWKELILTPFIFANYYDCIEKVKPYLRPMFSMTEEEGEEYRTECKKVLLMRYRVNSHYPITDWLNEHHFDYRGLIEKGLALEALEGMYKTE